MARSACCAASPLISRSFTGSTPIWAERNKRRPAGVWTPALDGPTALGAFPLCNARRSTTTAAGPRGTKEIVGGERASVDGGAGGGPGDGGPGGGGRGGGLRKD